MYVLHGLPVAIVLLFVLWYCHKRGREVRLGKEQTVDGSDRVEELPDDALPESSAGGRDPISVNSSAEADTSVINLPPPPVGSGSAKK